MTSRSRTTIEDRSDGSRHGRRLPTDRPPTHPGEVLLEEFLEPLGISQVEFAFLISPVTRDSAPGMPMPSEPRWPRSRSACSTRPAIAASVPG